MFMHTFFSYFLKQGKNFHKFRNEPFISNNFHILIPMNTTFSTIQGHFWRQKFKLIIYLASRFIKSSIINLILNHNHQYIYRMQSMKIHFC